jgi:protein involved in polysaccharide export with SLBB domain
VEVKDLTPSDIVVSVRNACRDQELIHEAEVSVVLVEPAERATVKSGPIGVGDVLLVRLWDVEAPETETSLALRVPDDGQLEFPRVGPITATGLTEGQLEERLIKVYHDKGLILKLPCAVLRTHAAEANPAPRTPPATTRSPK